MSSSGTGRGGTSDEASLKNTVVGGMGMSRLMLPSSLSDDDDVDSSSSSSSVRDVNSVIMMGDEPFTGEVTMIGELLTTAGDVTGDDCFFSGLPSGSGTSSAI